ncbi:MAG: Re/Si-specific NAD(P)(+) transhydrogenase subunit alpha [Planctomycetota bacterium]|jgi:NAD(P) transhydrogenase subunit alpha
MMIGTVKETFQGERRVALVPASVATLVKGDLQVCVEAGCGVEAGFDDDAYREAGATIADRAKVFESCQVICQVRSAGANPDAGRADLGSLRSEHTVIGLCEPFTDAAPVEAIAATGAQTFALELLPRITRAQSMDVLSSQATIGGYKAVLLAAERLNKMFPMMMTAAGTLSPAKVFVLGAGVAGLMAIATAKRLGAVVSAYDIRDAVKEQVESLGGKFVQLQIEAQQSEDAGGYAKAMDETFYKKQAELMTHTVGESDVVITTAAVPGKKAPILVTADMVAGMAPGSVVVDMAAERGGNCELTRSGEDVVEGGVTIMGPTNLPATVPNHASLMYSRNMTTVVQYLVKDGQLELDPEDEIVSGTMLTRDGAVVHELVREVLGLQAPVATEAGGS